MSDTRWIWQFDERIQSDPESGVAAIRQLLDQLESGGWSETDVFGIHMAMEEAVMNAIKHGNRGDSRKWVEIKMALSELEFRAKITDQGEGFNPEEVPDPTADENLEKFSGRGLMLMRNFVDEVVYNECGNSVRLLKVRTPSGPEGS